MNKELLIVAHCPSPNTTELAQALLDGASAIETVNSRVMSPFEATPAEALNCDAIILFTTENFGAMSGAIKDFFERIYYPCLAQENQKRNQGKPFALVIRAGLDGTGTNIGVHKIITGLKWKEAQPTLICHGDFQATFIEQCHELGLIMAASLDNDLI